MKKYGAFLVILLWTITVGANPQLEAFEQANRNYQQRNYQAAVSAYEQLLAEGYFSPELYFNLGNAYWKTEQTGRAVLNYERALRLAPGDEDVMYNLELVQTQLKDEIESLPPFFLTQWWTTLRKVMPGNGWSILSIISFWLFVGGIFLWLFGENRQQKKKGFVAAFILFVLTLLFFSLSYSRIIELNNDQAAIILAESIPLMSAPDEESIKMLDLHGGTEVIVLDSIGEWYKVRLANGDQGWMTQESIERI